MSENNWSNDDWQLGMTLPSRKETHSRKKKKRKPEKVPKDKGKGKNEKALEGEQASSSEQVAAEKQLSGVELGFAEGIANKETDSNRQVPLSEDPNPMSRLETETFFKSKSFHVSLPEHESPSQPQINNSLAEQAHKKDTPWQADNLVRAVQSFEAVPELESAKAIPSYTEQSPDQEAVEVAHNVLQQAKAETAAGAAAHDFSLTQSFPMVDSERDEPTDTALPTNPTQPAEEADTEAEEEEVPPIISKWQRRFLLTITPILVVITLLYGKIGYVHQIPDIVRKNVPAYAEGEGFLIVKPWWFGPPVIALDQMGNPQADSFEIYKATLSDYEGVLEKPWVLRTYPQDFLKK